MAVPWLAAGLVTHRASLLPGAARSGQSPKLVAVQQVGVAYVLMVQHDPLLLEQKGRPCRASGQMQAESDCGSVA